MTFGRDSRSRITLNQTPQPAVGQASNRETWLRRCRLALLPLLILILAVPAVYGQLTTGTLSGTVNDSSNAVVPGAKVVLLNEQTGDQRQTVSNSVGHFTFAAVSPGSYTVTIKATSFQTWQQSGITMNAGDSREVSQIALKVGAADVTVQVTGNAAQILPIDSGVKAAVLTSKDIEKLSIEGRNLSELLKVLPGVTTTANGTQGGSNVDFSAEAPTGSTVGVGYSPSGAPYRGGTSFMLDGANIIDPGCNCWSIAVPNPDMTAEVKVLQSFGADTQNGPVVIENTSKSGGKQFHGQAYFYARSQALNSNTWYGNYLGTPRQSGQYYYPGGNIGGPVLIPGTNFNHNRKLFFWFGYEYYKQTLPQATPLESYVPSAGMMAGNFTPSGSGNAALCPTGFSAGAKNWCNDLTGAVAPDGTPITGGIIPAKYLDSGAAALMKMFPSPNVSPSSNPGGYNYVQNVANQQNGYVWRARLDYNINENTKLFLTYQTGTTTYITVAHAYWNPAFDIPYPGGTLDQPTTSRVVTANLVNILSPSLTNEFVFGWGWANEPFSPSNLSAIYKSTLGYNYKTVYNTASQVVPSLSANYTAQTFPDISQPAFFNSSGVYPTKKAIPSFADNVTKVWRNHTFKFGAFTELVGNQQGVWSYANGNLSFGNQPMPNNVTGSQVAAGTKIGSFNPTANLVMGVASNFTQNSYAPVQDMAYRTTSAYLQDDWKVVPRLLVSAGLRFDHVGRWYDRQGVGMAVWMPQLYASDVAINQASKSMVIEYPGIRWHGIDPGIPNGGAPVHFAYTSPRVGFSYDLKGNGETVVRGGWGEYTWNDQPSGALSTSQNMQTYNSPSNQAITLSQIGLQSPSGNPQPAGGVTAVPYNDYAVPLTYAWNLTVDRQLPWKSLLEVGYVGNSSHHMLMGGQSDGVGIGGAGFSNLNKVPLGGLFQPDPVTLAAAPADPDNTSTYNITDYRPYSGCVTSGGCYGYGDNSVTVNNHLGYSNYNGLQVAWLKQAGKLSFNLNYTWSKSLGILGTTLDAFSVHGNYGILAIDRPQVFNSSYAYSLGSLYHGGFKLLGGVVNGWTISGITTFQSGANLQANANNSQNLGLTIEKQDALGNNIESLTTKSYFGTDVGAILPVTTCNPTSGLAAQQKVKLSCFSAPTIGTQGLRQIHPYLSGPIYTDSDLTVYKTFAITERQNVQLRASAFDFMNHSLWGFSGNNLLTLNLATKDGGKTFYTNDSILGVSQSKWGIMDQKFPYSGAGYARIIELSAKYNF